MLDKPLAGMKTSGRNPRIQRHTRPSPDSRPSKKVARYRDAIARHIEEHWGEPSRLFHDTISEYVRVHIHVVEATKERPYHTLITSGMSDRPMRTPKEVKEYRFAELVISLPPTWPLDGKGWKHERHWWPFQWLRQIARLPHEFNTFLFYGHTVPNGDPAKPFAPGTKLCCMLLSSPVLCGEEADTLAIDKKTQIHFYSPIPIYREEMDFALSRGSVELLERLENAGVTELWDLQRTNVCKGGRTKAARLTSRPKHAK